MIPVHVVMHIVCKVVLCFRKMETMMKCYNFRFSDINVMVNRGISENKFFELFSEETPNAGLWNLLITSINAFVFISFVDYVFIEYKYWPIIDIFMLNKVYRGNTRLEKPSLPGYWNSDFIKLEFCGNGNLKSVSAIIYYYNIQSYKKTTF